MEERTLLTTNISFRIVNGSVSQLRQEYLRCQELLQMQASLLQRYLETQAALLAVAVTRNLSQVRFILPDQVILQNHGGDHKTMPIPTESREQSLGGLMGRLIGIDLRTALRSRLLELEQSSNRAISTSAILLRYVLVMYLVHNMLPSGKSVQYKVIESEEIPSLPVDSRAASESAFTATTDATGAEEGRVESRRGELLVPYAEAARGFYLPQWVAFDDQNHLLVRDLNQAEAHIDSMQGFLGVLHTAVGLAPYMVADEEYQRKRYGILGQLVNQGRALARYQVDEIIRTINHRASSHDLNRGLSLSLPYFNDQTLTMDTYSFEVIPSGRIMFVPAFIGLAVREQGAKVAQDTRLSQSTRRHLLTELSILEQAFVR